MSVDLLRYYYYGGLVFIGLKRFNDALDFFKTVSRSGGPFICFLEH